MGTESVLTIQRACRAISGQHLHEEQRVLNSQAEGVESVSCEDQETLLTDSAKNSCCKCQSFRKHPFLDLLNTGDF